MNYNQVDTRGRSCPEPVLMTKKALARFPEGVQVITDNTTARDNVTRFAKSSGYSVATEQQGFEYILTLTRK